MATEAVLNVIVSAYHLEPLLGGWLRRYHLSLSEFNLLEILRGAGEPLPPYMLAERLLATRSRSSVTNFLDSLQTKGLVRRAPHPTDRRMLLIEITDAGMALLKEMLPRLHRDERVWMSPLGPAEKDTLIELLGKIQRHVTSLQSAKEAP